MEEGENLQNLENIGEDDPLNRSPTNPTVICSFSCAGRNFWGLPRNFRTSRSDPDTPQKVVLALGGPELSEFTPELPDLPERPGRPPKKWYWPWAGYLPRSLPGNIRGPELPA